jgi:hypothetical protein
MRAFFAGLTARIFDPWSPAWPRDAWDCDFGNVHPRLRRASHEILVGRLGAHAEEGAAIRSAEGASDAAPTGERDAL